MSTHQDHRLSWTAREEIAERMVPLIGQLYRTSGVDVTIYGRTLVHESAISILKAHRFARQIDSNELAVDQTLPILQALEGIDLEPGVIDLGRLNAQYLAEGAGASLVEFLTKTVGRANGPAEKPGSTDVVLYGFGRIGRLVARLLIEGHREDSGPRLRAIVVRNNARNDLVKRASLLRRDSVHGPFDGTITVDPEANTILANGTLIQVIYTDDPGSIDYTQYDIHNAVLVDNTGRARTEEGLSKHLRAPGLARVVLTAPGSGSLKNIVYGINHRDIGDDKIVAAASCTTNGITPVLKVINDKFGIVHGHVETVHSYTNDQNLSDNFHAGDRRGRSAVLNMVIAETGAAKAVVKALPELAGKLTGNAIRVPTPDVSLAILNLTLSTPTSKDEVNTFLRDQSLHSDLHQQIDYIESAEVVSTDFVGSKRTGIVDGLATISEGTNLVLYVWYDNEYGYSCQVTRILGWMSGTDHSLVEATTPR